MLVSHNHADHLDDRALELARWLGCAVIGSRKAARRASRAGVRVALALGPGQETSVGGVTIRAVPAKHPFSRGAIGFVLEAPHSEGARTLYFSGDTRWMPELAAYVQQRVDVALVMAACAYYPLLGAKGMSLPDAADLARSLRPRWTVPLHLQASGKWLDRQAGVRLQRDNAGEVDNVLEHWASGLEEEGLSVKLLEPGESWTISTM
jgi:L-ascorbate metabolism protein UlaG (beta-lactamase superfamily)